MGQAFLKMGVPLMAARRVPIRTKKPSHLLELGPAPFGSLSLQPPAEKENVEAYQKKNSERPLKDQDTLKDPLASNRHEAAFPHERMAQLLSQVPPVGARAHKAFAVVCCCWGCLFVSLFVFVLFFVFFFFISFVCFVCVVLCLFCQFFCFVLLVLLACSVCFACLFCLFVCLFV